MDMKHSQLCSYYDRFGQCYASAIKKETSYQNASYCSRYYQVFNGIKIDVSTNKYTGWKVIQISDHPMKKWTD